MAWMLARQPELDLRRRYTLAPHVRICFPEDYAVLLDVRRGKYLALPTGELESVISLLADGSLSISGRPTPLAENCAAPNNTQRRTLSELLERGLLATDPQQGIEQRDIKLARPDSSLVEGYGAHRPAISANDVCNFVRACIVAWASLKLLPFDRSVRSVQKWTQARVPLPPDQLERLRDRVIAFQKLRPILFTARDACLFYSFAMSAFLKHYALTPHCVVGVMTNPFKAHCWLQQGSVVVNDEAEYVSRFTPILVI